MVLNSIKTILVACTVVYLIYTLFQLFSAIDQDLSLCFCNSVGFLLYRFLMPMWARINHPRWRINKVLLQIQRSRANALVFGDGPSCVVCMERQREILLLNCRHICLCADCMLAINQNDCKCPVCREPIAEVERVFLC